MKKVSLSNTEIHFSSLSKRVEADALVIPFCKGKSHPEAMASTDSIKSQIQQAMTSGDFKGSEGEVLQLYLTDEPEKRVILVGLGVKEKISAESLRRAYGSVTKHCLGRSLKSLNVVVPEDLALSKEEIAVGVTEGLLLPNYLVGLYKNKTEDSLQSSTVQKLTFIGLDNSKEREAAKTASIIAECVNYARNKVNGNADEITPLHLAESAKQLAKEHPHLKTTVLDKKHIEKEGMGLLLAVNRGSHLDPYFIIIEYKGAPQSSDHTVIVGKGITYDTGGLNIKVAGMEEMKCDMAGAAACLGLMRALADSQLKVNVTAVIPTTENGISATSYKPGDVYTGYAGISVEMMNSDAEGRLILADALAYAVDKLHPTRLIDFATLTGAIDIALGSEASGLMSTNDTLSQQLIDAGEVSGERLWRMPLYPEYRDRLKSDIADIKSWNGRSAGSCVAATFLREFVGEVPFAHIDIASTAFLKEAKKYLPKFSTGVGIRLMMEFFKGLK